jgi:hypothetical protein
MPGRAPSASAAPRRGRTLGARFDTMRRPIACLVAARGSAQSVPKRPRTGAWSEAAITPVIKPQRHSKATPHHFPEPLASPVRTPWRFKSSHPHSLRLVTGCEIDYACPRWQQVLKQERAPLARRSLRRALTSPTDVTHSGRGIDRLPASRGGHRGCLHLAQP